MNNYRKLEEEELSQVIAGETVLLASNNGLESSFILNRMASRVWELIGDNRLITEIAAEIADEYGLESRTAMAETEAIIACFQTRENIVNHK